MVVVCVAVSVPLFADYASRLYMYSQTSEERTLWEQRFCPSFAGCPCLGDSLFFNFVHNTIQILHHQKLQYGYVMYQRRLVTRNSASQVI